MKKVISFLWIAVLLMSIFALPSSVYASANVARPAKVTGLTLTTANKNKLLKLTWNQQTSCDGYQVFRSTTGKSGSYKRIATITKNAYIDKDLKASAAYYYKVRSFVNGNGKTVFGPFAKGDLSTKITAAFAAKRFNQAYKALSKLTLPPAYSDDCIYRKNMYGFEEAFMRVVNNKYSSKSDIQKYLEGFFTKSLAKTITNHFFAEANGKLYLWTPEAGMLGETNYNKTTAKITKTADNFVALKVTRVREINDGELYDIESFLYSTSMVYSKGKWVFSKGNVWTDEAFYV